MIITAADAAHLTSVLEELRVVMGAAACSFAAVDGAELVFSAATGIGADQVVGLRLPLSRGLASYVVVSGQSLAIADVRTDRRFDLETAQSTGLVPATILAVPVEDDESMLGVVEVLDRQAGSEDLEIAMRAAVQIATRLQGNGEADDSTGPEHDPRLDELMHLVAQFGHRDEVDRRRAAAALRTLLARRPDPDANP